MARMKMTRRVSNLRRLLFIPLLAITLTACGIGSPGDDPTPTPVATLAPGVTATAVNVTIGDRPSGSLSGLTQTLNLSGCRVTIPLEWISEGDGTGVTPSNAKFTIYGGKIADNAAWENAVQLVVNQANRKGAISVTRGGDWVMAIHSGDRGFTYRVRIDNGYCDFSVSSVKPIPEAERDMWNAVAGSVKQAPAGEGTPES